jgi:hypothetical protein
VTENFFAHIDSIVAELRALGHAARADALRDAVDYSFTGTELAMAVRAQLQRALSSATDLPSPTRDLITTLVTDLASELQ